TSCVSSCPQRNAITSSHSSTRGFPPGQRRTGPRMPRGLPRRSSRKASDGGPAPPCAAPVASQSNSRPEDAEASRGQKRTWENGPPTSDSPRPGKRRFPLLPRRRGEPLRLPAPPELGFRVTAGDLDAEKAAALRRINSALRDETPSPQPYRPFPAPADPPVPGRAPRPERGQRESASPAPPTSGVPDVQQRRAPAWGHSPHCGNPAAPALTGNPTSAPGPPAPPTNSPMGTRASTQPASAAFPAGPAPAAATCVPQAVPSAGPRSGPRCPAVGGSRTAPCRPGGSAAPRGVGSHPAVRAPLSTRRPAHKYPVTLHLRFVRASLRWCCMIPQALRSFLGVLTSLCRRHHQRKPVLGARISTMCRGSASAVGTVPGCGGRQQQVTPVPPTTLRCAPGSCTEKTVRSALGESGKGLAQQEGDPAFRQKDHQKGGPDGSRGARSTFRPFGARGDFSAFVPRPGPLRRNLHAESSVDTSAEKLQTSCVSSCPQRNAITSSHSSTRGFPPGQRRTGPRMPRGLPRRSSRKASDGGPAPPCAAPVASQSNSRPEDAEASRGQKRTWENGPPTSDSPRPGKRRFPLLPRRRGEPLRLPAPPELGFRVTAGDLDAEKAAALRRINSALRDETPSPQPYRPFPAPADPPPAHPVFSPNQTLTLHIWGPDSPPRF
ncbi:unnamed protein product, partial [Rangifer tarandus platyrhynchus]